MIKIINFIRFRPFCIAKSCLNKISLVRILREQINFPLFLIMDIFSGEQTMNTQPPSFFGLQIYLQTCLLGFVIRALTVLDFSLKKKLVCSDL